MMAAFYRYILIVLVTGFSMTLSASQASAGSSSLRKVDNASGSRKPANANADPCSGSNATSLIKQQLRQEVFKENPAFTNISIGFKSFAQTASAQGKPATMWVEYRLAIEDSTAVQVKTEWLCKRSYLLLPDAKGGCTAILQSLQKEGLALATDSTAVIKNDLRN